MIKISEHDLKKLMIVQILSFMYFILCLFLLNNDIIFKGSGAMTSNKTTRTSWPKNIEFILTLEQSTTILNETVYRCSLDFFMENQADSRINNILFGFEFNQGQEFFLIRDPRFRTLNDTISFLHTHISNFNDENIMENITSIIESHKIPIILFFQLADQKPNPSTFVKDKHLAGFYSSHNTIFYQIHADLFDMISFTSEGKIFGVFFSFFILANIYAWYNMGVQIRSRVIMKHISALSLMLIIGFDFSFALIMIDISMQYFYLTKLYALLFGFMMLLYHFLQMPTIIFHWITNVSTREENPNQRRFSIIMYFFQFLFTMIVSMLSSSEVFTNPYPYILILFSGFIPQIISLYKYSHRVKQTLVFFLIIYFTKIITLFYFTLYRRNIMSTYSTSVALVCSIYWTLQILIIILQSFFGGDFFIPKFLRQHGFDYSIRNPEITECAICMSPITEEDITMTPPCRHTFHRECLRRWMQEEFNCPICRMELPPET